MSTKKPQPESLLRVILITTVVSLALTALAAYAAGYRFWFPDEASTVAPGIDRVFNIITWISIYFFVLIVILLVYFVIKYRRLTPDMKAQGSTTHNTPLELTWTIIPLILVIAIFYAGMEGYLNLRRSPLGAYEVHVQAQRWSWNFQHRNGLSEETLLVPVNRPVKLLMESSDVLHALFIPAFRVKQDIVPGRITTLWFECNQPGKFELFCAEYCGRDHSQMHAVVEALPEDQFEAELAKRADVIKTTPPEAYPEYVLKHIYPRCSSCHSLDGKTGTGPTWRGVWKDIEEGNVVFTDGTKLKDLTGQGKQFESPEDYIRDSVLNPQNKIVMNFTGAMPTFKGQLKDVEIQAIIEMFKHLDEFDEKGNPKPGTPAAERAAKAKADAAAAKENQLK